MGTVPLATGLLVVVVVVVVVVVRGVDAADFVPVAAGFGLAAT